MEVMPLWFSSAIQIHTKVFLPSSLWSPILFTVLEYEQVDKNVALKDSQSINNTEM
jgi:hypothetical protein